MRPNIAWLVAIALLGTGCSGERNSQGPQGADSSAPIQPAVPSGVETVAAAQKPSSPSIGGQGNGQDELPAGKPAPTVRYTCEDGRTVLAQYVESDALQQVVNLEIAGRELGLSQVMSASGARYETDKGLTSGKKLVWWTKGPSAMLIESEQDGSNETTANCKEV